MRKVLIGLVALSGIIAGSTSANAMMCRGPNGWGNYAPQYCHHYRHRSSQPRFYQERFYQRRTVAPQRFVGGARRVTTATCAPGAASVGVSAQEAFSRVAHRTTSACVPCVAGYSQDPNTCECSRTTWHPGSPLQ